MKDEEREEKKAELKERMSIAKMWIQILTASALLLLVYLSFLISLFIGIVSLIALFLALAMLHPFFYGDE